MESNQSDNARYLTRKPVVSFRLSREMKADIHKVLARDDRYKNQSQFVMVAIQSLLDKEKAK